MDLRDWSEAIKQFQATCEIAGKDQASRAQEMLARAYLASGDRAAALKHVQLAIDQAAPQQKPALLELQKQFTGGN
jgi:Tfp pilus assembly protein FimV